MTSRTTASSVPPASGRRGAPLIALGLLVAGWVGARLLWVDAVPLAGPSFHRAPASPQPRGPATAMRGGPSNQRAIRVAVAGAGPIRPIQAAPYHAAGISPLTFAPTSSLILAPMPPAPPRPEPLPPRHANRTAMAGGRQLLWLAATALLPLPEPPSPAPVSSRDASPEPGQARLSQHWSGQSWILLRPTSAAPTGMIAPRYGASQIGGLVRFRPAPVDPGWAPASVYLRLAHAIDPPHQTDVAAGIGWELSALRLMAELRLDDIGHDRRLRPAVLAVSALPPVALPHGGQGEIYGQAGWVSAPAGGGFVDTLARAEWPVAAAGAGTRLRGGIGGWAAAQPGAARVDLGPVVSLTTSLGDRLPVRVELDWRWRVAGRARPGSGPALTLSAGF